MEAVTILLLGLAAICMTYFVIIILYTGPKGAFAPFWLVSAIGFCVLALVTHFINLYDLWRDIHPVVYVVFATVFAVPLSIFFINLFRVLGRMGASPKKPKKSPEVLIVLGAKVSGRRITKSLRKRLYKAEEYLKTYEDAVSIVSGGQGEGEEISEAEAMRDFLIGREIKADRIIMEDKSTTTKENLIFSYEIIKERFSIDAEKLIVTNNFHIYRAERLAKKIGISNIQGLAAPSDMILVVNYIFRECAALLKEKMLGNI